MDFDQKVEKDNNDKCQFMGRNQICCGRTCEEGKQQCKMHYNILFSPIMNLQNNEDHENNDIRKRAVKRQAIDNDAEMICEKRKIKDDKSMHDIIQRMQDLEIYKKKFDFMTDEFEKKMASKVKSKFYYTMKEDDLFCQKVIKAFIKKNYKGTDRTDKKDVIKLKNVPYQYFRKKTNQAFDNLSTDDQNEWVKKVEKEIGLFL